MARIEVLVGMIASGKSTYARRRADEGALVVCHDDLCRMLHAGLPVGPAACGYDPDLRTCYRKIEEAIARLAIEFDRDVVIDRTHLTRESRERWLTFARWPSFAEWSQPPVVAVAFPIMTPHFHARRRVEADPRGRSYDEWLDVAWHHRGQAEAEPLAEDEGFAEIIRIGAPEGVTLG